MILFSDQHRFLFFNINQAKGVTFSIDTAKTDDQDELQLLMSYDHNVNNSGFSGTLEFGVTWAIGPSNGVDLLDSLRNSIDIKSSLLILKIGKD